LTHAVGDVPVLNQGDSNNDDVQNISDVDEDDSVLEVDSPLHSPNNSNTNNGRSPSPMHMPVSAELQDETDEHENEEREHVNHEEEFEPPPTPMPEKSEKDIIPVTHCHHERSSGSQSPYTMRPQNSYDHYQRHRSPTPSGSSSTNGSNLATSQYLSQSQDSLNTLQIHPSSSGRADIFLPMLHVRRDLHHKLNRPSSTITSSLVDNSIPNFLSSIPLRKRPIGADGEPYLPNLPRNIALYNMHRNHPLMKPPEDLIISPIIAPDPQLDSIPPQQQQQIIGSPTLSTQSSSSLSSPGNVAKNQAQQQQSNGPPKRTGFSIEDIMRR
jgi:odd-skipped-like protein